MDDSSYRNSKQTDGEKAKEDTSVTDEKLFVESTQGAAQKQKSEDQKDNEDENQEA